MSTRVSVQDVGNIDIGYSSVDYFASITPSLRFSFIVTGLNEHLGLRDIGASLYLVRVDGSSRHIGRMVSEEPLMSLPPGTPAGFDLLLELDHYKLHQIEKFREGRDLTLRLKAKFVLEKWGQPQNRNVGTLDNFDIRIPKSDWVEKILPHLDFKDVSLIELPKLTQEWGDITEHLNEAWRQHSMGKYDNVLTGCRKALETLGDVVKGRGFAKTIENEKKSLPDWAGLFNSKKLGNIIGITNKKTHGFLAPGAHAGKPINREDADYALLVTHGIVALVTEKLLKMPE